MRKVWCGKNSAESVVRCGKHGGDAGGGAGAGAGRGTGKQSETIPLIEKSLSS